MDYSVGLMTKQTAMTMELQYHVSLGSKKFHKMIVLFHCRPYKRQMMSNQGDGRRNKTI